MIRSRSIPAVLSRITGEGIHAILLIDADGELLGSYGSPPPPNHSQDDNGNGGAAAHNDKIHWPLDAASIGALISEVAGDYRRMGEELLLLDPLYDSQRQSNGSGAGGQKQQQNEGGQSNQDVSSNGIEGEGVGVDGGNSALQQAGGKNGSDSGTNLKSLVIELDYGIVGVATAGPDFYVIALADPTVQHGALAGRLQSMGSHVREALSQLD